MSMHTSVTFDQAIFLGNVRTTDLSPHEDETKIYIRANYQAGCWCFMRGNGEWLFNMDRRYTLNDLLSIQYGLENRIWDSRVPEEVKARLGFE